MTEEAMIRYIEETNKAIAEREATIQDLRAKLHKLLSLLNAKENEEQTHLPKGAIR